MREMTDVRLYILSLDMEDAGNFRCVLLRILRFCIQEQGADVRTFEEFLYVRNQIRAVRLSSS